MRNRIVAVASTLAAVAVLAGCGTSSHGQLASTATATVNGYDLKPNLVRCYQRDWFQTITLGDDTSGATVVIDQRASPVVATSVRFNNFGGFTGTYSLGTGDAANTRFDGGTFLIAGTANGATTAKPTEPASADFTISAKC